MKKFLICCVVMFSAVFVAAEEMKFVTLLSQPVGSFSRVELLDQASPAEIFHLNFCNTDASGGTITLSSSQATPVDVEKLVVNSAGVLGGNVDYFRANKITVYDNPGFEGGTLLSVDLTGPAKILVDDQSSKTAEFIHGNAVTIKAADFNTMNIYNTAVLDTPASGSTLSSALTWQKVTTTEDKTTPDAYILTDWGTNSSSTCVEKTCSLGQVWNATTCKCETQDFDIGDFTPFCPSPKVWDRITRTCKCSQIRYCLEPKVWNNDTCACETPVNFKPVTNCGNIVCRNGTINAITCKCIPYATIN